MSSAIDAKGVVAPVSIVSEVGVDVVFDTPWAVSDAPTVADGAGAAVATKELASGVYSFATKAGGEYTIANAGR